jgi:hypothetical protein
MMAGNWRTWVLAGVLALLAVGGPGRPTQGAGGPTACPEQLFASLEGLDLERVATDPVTERKLVVARCAAYLGDTVEIKVHVCDPDNDDPGQMPRQTLRLWREPSGETLNIDTEGNAVVTVRCDTVGWHYETVAVTDEVSLRLGTYVVWVQQNRPPVLGGGCRILGR